MRRGGEEERKREEEGGNAQLGMHCCDNFNLKLPIGNLAQTII